MRELFQSLAISSENVSPAIIYFRIHATPVRLDDFELLLTLLLGTLLGCVFGALTTQFGLLSDGFTVVRVLLLTPLLGRSLGSVFGASATHFRLLFDRFSSSESTESSVSRR